ncbi:MAG: response regulator [Gammaproteobacteria bacterium]|nr:response regulator [Gammaproteobacteria bacterium]MBU1441907.1 response regulator [Gammaproteobacteria bacterium]MBU2285645.1 response regulator [Gammaproteobacteria bacterium]MBU2410237.1 response regulator [Gammaproteobacteria bacterium]
MKLSTYIVEDDPTTLATLIELLEATGNVKVAGWAATEFEAVRWLTEHPNRWSLLVVDYQLAQGDGMRVLAACRVRGYQQRAVLLTAHASAELRRRCLDLGADQVFDKAAGIEPLLAMCEQWNRALALSEENRSLVGSIAK